MAVPLTDVAFTGLEPEAIAGSSRLGNTRSLIRAKTQVEGVSDMARAIHGLLVTSVAATALLLGNTPPARGQSVQVEEADVLARVRGG
jgi:hypothetical protein